MSKTQTAKHPTKTAAVLTIYRPADMTSSGRADIVKWLRQQVLYLCRYPDQLGPRYTARYQYREGR